MLSATDDDDDDDDDEKGLVAGFDSIPVPWLTSVASHGSSLKSAPAVDAEGVPGACHAEESSRLRSARVQMCNSR